MQDERFAYAMDRLGYSNPAHPTKEIQTNTPAPTIPSPQQIPVTMAQSIAKLAPVQMGGLESRVSRAPATKQTVISGIQGPITKMVCWKEFCAVSSRFIDEASKCAISKGETAASVLEDTLNSNSASIPFGEVQGMTIDQFLQWVRSDACTLSWVESKEAIKTRLAPPNAAVRMGSAAESSDWALLHRATRLLATTTGRTRKVAQDLIFKEYMTLKNTAHSDASYTRQRTLRQLGLLRRTGHMLLIVDGFAKPVTLRMGCISGTDYCSRHGTWRADPRNPSCAIAPAG